jgi:hypothetical protein
MMEWALEYAGLVWLAGVIAVAAGVMAIAK